MITQDTLMMVSVASGMGIVTRLLTLKQDYRQYPSYPNGYFTHIILGVIAAVIGAMIIPAIIEKNYTAVTFLTIAVQQFRDVRKIERESLKALENTEFTIRGDAYIDGIAKTFESRNYMVLSVALITALTMQITDEMGSEWQIGLGDGIGSLVFVVLRQFTKGMQVKDIANVRCGTIRVEGSELYVDEIYVTNTLGTKRSQELVRQEGMAVVVTPKEEHFRITLDNYGQRQAILFEACRALGVKRYQFTRKEYVEGNLVVALVPIIRDESYLIKVVEESPLLEDVTKNHRIMKNKYIKGRK